jgi:branched-chain amino acid transport system permease protein
MSIIGGTQSWMGPIVGGIIVSGLQQYLSATISSSLSLLVTGVTVLLVIFFIPKGVVATIRRGKS